MRNVPRFTYVVIIALFVIFIALLIAHEIVEVRIFRMLSRQPGLDVTIGSRVGNLLSGYELKYVDIRQAGNRGDMPPANLSIPGLTVHWELLPFVLTEIAWEEGNITVYPDDNPQEEISFGNGSLVPVRRGWLESDDEITLGPGSWLGSMDLQIRADARDMKGTVNIERMPSRLVRILGDVPDWFDMPPLVSIEMSIEGTPGNIVAKGKVIDPFTKEIFSF